MKSRSLLLLLPALLIAALVWLWARPADPGAFLPEDGNAPRGTGSATGAGSEATTRNVAEAPPASRVALAPGETAPASRPEPPIPADAQAYEFLVVDQATGRPEPGADVWWSDGTTWERMPRRLSGRRAPWPVDQELIARDWGWHTRSDELGIARVRGKHNVQVHARGGSRYGIAYASEDQPAPPGGWRLELAEDLTLRVRVLDVAGTPAADVPLMLTQHGPDGAFLRVWQGGPMPSTEADGLARFAHLQQWRLVEDGGPAAAEWRVRTRVPGHDDPGVGFDPRSPPAEPIVLRLPACGSVVVRVTFQGKPLPNDRSFPPRVILDRSPGGPGPDSQWSLPLEDSMARFPAIPVGSTLVARVRTMGVQCEQKVTGPAAAGHEVVVPLALPDTTLALAGRLLDPDRQPLRDTTAWLDFRTTSVSGGASLSTDGEGRFLLLLGNARDQNRIERFIASRQMRGELALRAEVTPRELSPGINDLGDLVLEPGPLLVAGRFLNGDQPYRLHVPFSVERLEERRGSSGDWRYVEGATPSQAEDGRFAVRGQTQPGRYRLQFPVYGSHLPIAPIEFTPGTADLVVPVRVGVGLAATALIPPALPAGLRAVVVPRGTTPASPAENHAVDWWEREPGKATATWPAVEAGSYRLEVRVWGATAPLVTIDDVQVPAAPPDPRLADIDLRDRVAALTVRVVDASGTEPKPVRSGFVFLQPVDPRDAEWPGFPVWEGNARLPVPPASVDLLVCSEGFRPAEVPRPRGEVTVELRPWPEVEISFPDLPELPSGVRLMAYCEQPRVTGRYVLRGGSGGREFLRAPSAQREIVAGRVRLPVDDQPRRLHMFVTAGGRNARSVRGVEPVEIRAGAEPVTVRVPEDALRAALAELRAK